MIFNYNYYIQKFNALIWKFGEVFYLIKFIIYSLVLWAQKCPKYKIIYN